MEVIYLELLRIFLNSFVYFLFNHFKLLEYVPKKHPLLLHKCFFVSDLGGSIAAVSAVQRYQSLARFIP